MCLFIYRECHLFCFIELAVFDQPKAFVVPEESSTTNVAVYVIVAVLAFSALVIVLFITLWKKRRNRLSKRKKHSIMHDISSEQNSLKKILGEIEEPVK